VTRPFLCSQLCYFLAWFEACLLGSLEVSMAQIVDDSILLSLRDMDLGSQRTKRKRVWGLHARVLIYSL
jgi:hypothetical protein